VFIAYDLTSLKFSHILILFLLGRLISSHVWVVPADAETRSLAVACDDTPSYLREYGIVSQLLLLALVYAFICLDWRALCIDKRLRWLRGRPPENRAPEG
jgi:hypothetical protein